MYKGEATKTDILSVEVHGASEFKSADHLYTFTSFPIRVLNLAFNDESLLV